MANRAILSDMAVQIYVFYFLEAGQKRYFYVGRSKDLQRRMREHNRSKHGGHEDKYARIRDVEAAGMPWFSEAIEAITNDDYFPDAERWHVIRLTREGHELMNMRHGSIEHRRELAEQITAKHIRSAADVRADRHHRKFQASKKLRRKIWIKELEKHGIPNEAAAKMLPTVFQRKLRALAQVGGFSHRRYAPGFTLEEFIDSIRKPLSKEREFRNWVISLNLSPIPSETARQ